jgi:hypothetical protein
MKLSNKILLGFFGTAFIYLTAAFAEVRFSGTPNILTDKNSISETVDIPGITHVAVRDFRKNVKITTSNDRPRLEVRSRAGEILKEVEYKISGDTLVLSRMNIEASEMVTITVYAPVQLKGITVDRSFASVQDLELGSLSVSENNGRIWMSRCQFDNMEMSLSNRSSLDISDASIDTLSVQMQHSEATIYAEVGLLKGSLENASIMRMLDMEEMQLKKDKSSRLNVYQ